MAIAVAVQRMVEADAAGVMFTADPVSGDRHRIVIDASPGLGEAVVSGLVTPDHYELNLARQVLSWSPGRREVVIRPAAGGGVTRETPAPGMRPPAGTGAQSRKPLLPDSVLRELARLGTTVARHFGRPQDIEWACTGGRVWLVQARPMTALPPPPLRLNAIQRRIAAILLELLPMRPYPIDLTTWLPHGPMGMMVRMIRRLGFQVNIEGIFEEQDEVVYRLVPPSPRPTLGILQVPFLLARAARRFEPDRWREDPRFTEALARIRDLERQPLQELPWPALRRLPRQLLDVLAPLGDLRLDYLARGGLSLLGLVLILILLRRSFLLGDLLLGAPTRTADANRALERLAQQVRGDARLQETVEALDVRRLVEFPGFYAAFEAFLDEYGHRETASAILMTAPTWADAPETVLALLKVLAADPPASSAAQRADRALEGLLAHPLLHWPRLRAWVRRRVEQARTAVAVREDTHFYATRPLPLLRCAVLEMGRRLCLAGVLQEPEQVFHLRLEELEGIENVEELSGPKAQRLRAAVSARAAKREELAGTPLINPTSVYPPQETGTNVLVSGTPGSGGTATGPVRVIRDPKEFSRLQSGDVLVCPYTNPSWTPLLQRAVAVVVDSGGAASHAAIVAREYGIPAVMGTAVGTTVLEDGQRVTVDGDRGVVTPAATAD